MNRGTFTGVACWDAVYVVYAGCGNGDVYLYACCAFEYPCCVKFVPRYGAPVIFPAAGLDITARCGPLNVAETDGEIFGYALRGTAVLPYFQEKNWKKTKER